MWSDSRMVASCSIGFHRFSSASLDMNYWWDWFHGSEVNSWPIEPSTTSSSILLVFPDVKLPLHHNYCNCCNTHSDKHTARSKLFRLHLQVILQMQGLATEMLVVSQLTLWVLFRPRECMSLMFDVLLKPSRKTPHYAFKSSAGNLSSRTKASDGISYWTKPIEFTKLQRTTVSLVSLVPKRVPTSLWLVIDTTNSLFNALDTSRDQPCERHQFEFGCSPAIK